MSGGSIHSTNHILMIIEDIEAALADPDCDFRPETILEFRRSLGALSLAEFLACEVDLLLSGDTSEDSFHARIYSLRKELGQIQEQP
jgi:hypothetical protein